MDDRRVSIAVTNWNGRRYLEDCIAAALAQTVPPAEVILVDNASDDDGVAFVRARFPEVRIVELPENLGPCPARNAGLAAARHRLVLSIDNDAMLAPDCLERLLAEFGPGIAVVQPRSVFDAEPDHIHYDGAAFHYVGMMTLRNFYAPVAEADSASLDVDAAISVALLMDRDLVLEAGGYDPAHFILFEDHDLSYRLRLRGWRIRHVPGALVRHREGTAGISFRDRGSYSGRRVLFHSRNRWIGIVKNHGWRAILLGAPGLLLYETAYLFFALKNRCLGSWLRGKWDLLRLLPRLLAARRVIQRARKVRDRDLLGAAPLTISPLIERKGLVMRAQAVMERLLSLWWRLVRPLT
ncbi:MAG: glycosyltransferase family 2 protein [Planctomycetes bacterium]|nr:glycosyltransferase family 2 protein [Planctomycetota bacterium]